MMNDSNDHSEWEVRPCGMLVQRRDEAASDQSHQDPAVFGQPIRLCISHGSLQHDLQVSPHATFGDVKKALVLKTGLELSDMKILFRGIENDDSEQLHSAGVKDASRVSLIEDPNKVVEQVEQPPVISEEMVKAIAAVTAVIAEVDKLSEQVFALEVTVNGGSKVAVEEFDLTAELLMRQLLKLDGIEAEGEARILRKAEVRRVQKYHEIVDNLKARSLNPLVDNSKAAAVSTEWESFENGVGSLNPPPASSSSAGVTQDWEKFD